MVKDPESQAEDALLPEMLRQEVKGPGFTPKCRACKVTFKTVQEATDHIKEVHSK